jgi:hypothetical protein
MAIRKVIGITACNGLPLLFASVDRRQMLADFQGGELTSDGGITVNYWLAKNL